MALRNDSQQLLIVKDGPTSEEWEYYRSIIQGLYVDKDKTLTEVMKTMQHDYGFKASVKMYKIRIAKWKLDKNCKLREMKAIARKKVQRDAVGIRSSFHIRQRQIDVNEVYRYFKRKNFQSLEDVVAKSSPAADTPSDVQCLTPDSIDCNDGDEEHQARPHHQQISANETLRHLSWLGSWKYINFSALEIHNSLNTYLHPTSFAKHCYGTSMLAAIDDIFCEIFGETIHEHKDGGKAISYNTRGESDSSRYAIWDFYDWCEAARYLLKHGMFIEARQMLFKACEMSKDILVQSHLRTVPIMFDIYFRFHRAGYVDAAIKVLQHLNSIAFITASGSGAFRRFLGGMLLVDEDVDELYFVAYKCCQDIFEEHLHVLDHTRLASRLEYIEQIGAREGWHAAEKLLRSLLIQCEQNCQKSDPRRWEVLLSLAWNLYHQNEYVEAEAIGTCAIQCLSGLRTKRLLDLWTIEALEIVSTAQRKQDKIELAQYNLGHCIDLAVKRYGTTHPRTIKYFLMLEIWHREWGLQDEAFKLARRRSKLLGPSEMED